MDGNLTSDEIRDWGSKIAASKKPTKKLHFIRMAPVIDGHDLPNAVFREIDGSNTMDHLIYVMEITYPLFYAWLVEQGAFKHGETGYVGII